MVEFRKLFAEDGGRFFALRGEKKKVQKKAFAGEGFICQSDGQQHYCGFSKSKSLLTWRAGDTGADCAFSSNTSEYFCLSLCLAKCLLLFLDL